MTYASYTTNSIALAPCYTAYETDGMYHVEFHQPWETPAVPTPTETAAQRVARERRERKEQARVEAAYQEFDDFPLLETPLTVYRFNWKAPAASRRNLPARTLTYVALAVLQDDDTIRWYLTGQETASRTTDEFVDWLVAHSISRHELYGMS